MDHIIYTVYKFVLLGYFLHNTGCIGVHKCTTARNFGYDCKYYCHCVNSEICDLVTGRCSKAECDGTYSGPSCQKKIDGACLRGSFGSDCQYLCHCGNSRRQCNRTTGACAAGIGCTTGYHGGNCQIENIALGKFAAQSSEYSQVNKARLAVDGDENSVFNESVSNPKCSHTNSAQAESWWYVDLVQVFPIQRIRIYNIAGSNQDRLSGFQIKVGERRSDYEVCYTDPMISVPPLVIDVTCGRVIKGRFVKINTGHTDQMLTLCEVQVLVCTDYWYGSDCDRTCNCADVNEVCDKNTGECPKSGCSQYYGGIDCNECDLGNYGDDCSSSCSSRCKSVTPGYRICHLEQGTCTAGCKSGYRPPLCNDVCVWNHYGDCKTPCSEHCGLTDGRACKPVTGFCSNTTSCRRGFQGPRCDEVCDAGNYGDNCLKRCGSLCSHNKCDHVTGQCEEGCLPGYTGKWCQKKCKARHFGLNCVHSCDFCAVSPDYVRACDHIKGQCFVGCTSGYRGDMCDTVCPRGYYGGNCTAICDVNCAEVCHHVTGKCSSGCKSGYKQNGGACAIDDTSNPGKPAGIVIGCLIVVGVIVAVVVVLILRRKRARKSRENVERETPCVHYSDENGDVIKRDTSGTYERQGSSPPDIVVSAGVSAKNVSHDGQGQRGYEEEKINEETDDDMQENLYCNALVSLTLPTDRGVAVSDLWDYVSMRKASGELKEEYKFLPKGLIHKSITALRPENKGKSRYQNIYAYDHSRVILGVLDEDTYTDYINANYVSGYTRPKKYIASQGPTNMIMEDFWRMVWQENSTTIIMLSRLFEAGKVKCDQYWPDSGSKDYGDVVVKMIHVEDFPDFHIRTLQVKHLQQQGKRLIKQFHFKSWPDHGVPDYATALVRFRDKLISMNREKVAPIIIHCSAGIGRTGTYMGIDYLVEQATAEGRVDIFKCIKNMRDSRVGLIQTAEQYVFLHEALVEALKLSALSTTSFEFMDKYARLQRVNPVSQQTYLQEQYEMLELLSPTISTDDFKTAELEENKFKNRDPYILAADNHRPFLSTPAKGTTNYINAVFLPAYTEQQAFICTQMPLPGTVIDFWRMIYENKCRTIVMLNNYNTQEDGRYWPVTSNEPLTIGPFTVRMASHEHGEQQVDFITLELVYSKESERILTIHQFQCMFWPESMDVPSSTFSMIMLLEEVERWQQQSGNSSMVIHCTNGVQRSGVYCTISTVIERMKIEQDVNISQSIKQLRIHRPQIIAGLTQYQFCHDAVITYLENFQTYSNFK